MLAERAPIVREIERLRGREPRRGLAARVRPAARGELGERAGAAAKDYSSSSYLLSNFLISEKGNYHLNGDGYKVVAFRVSRFMDVMNIQHSRAANRKSAFLDELETVDVIEKTSPTIAELKQLTPSKLADQLLYIYLNSSVKSINEKIKSAL